MSSAPQTIHVKARGAHPAYPARAPVDDDKVNWATPHDEYTPVEFTHDVVLQNDSSIKINGWADPRDMKTEDMREKQSHYPLTLDNKGKPRNPNGRTGMCGRGLLGKWGPNHAADPIVTRIDPTTRCVQMVAIKRKDTGEWAIPGGMVDPGESVSATIRREFTEEAGNLDGEERARFDSLVTALFAEENKRCIFAGYVDDPRNTDHAWMETTAVHYHCNREIARRLAVHAGDDAADVTWLNVDDDDPRYRNLYASHKEWVDKAAGQLLMEIAKRQREKMLRKEKKQKEKRQKHKQAHKKQLKRQLRMS